MAAEFIYPSRGNFSAENDNRMINSFDTLYVEYDSSWPSLNLTLFCLQGATSTQWQYLNVPGNPILASGTYQFGTIAAVNFDIKQYPTKCHLKLTEYGDNDNGLSGEDFWVTSNSASSTTFEPTSTSASSIAAATTQSAESASLVTVMTSSAVSQTSTTPSPTASTTNVAQMSQGLGTGAKAGIGVGVAAAIILILALFFIISRKRRRAQENKQHNSEPPHGTLEVVDASTHSSKYFQSYRQELDGSNQAELAGHESDYRHELHS